MKSIHQFWSCLLLTFGMAAISLLSAQEVSSIAATPKRKLTVLVKPVKPFAFERGGAVVGYSIELWRRVAQEASLDFEFTLVATVPELIERLKQKQADAGIGAISITAEREAIVDFTHSFYESGLQILAPVHGGSSIGSAFKKLFTPENGKLLGGLLVALVLISHVLWYVERRRNSESFPENYVAGVWEATWWSICTGITGGCENFLSENPGTKLELVGEIFDKQNYGFALVQGSPLRKELNRALLKVAEEGFFSELDARWFASVTK